MSASHARRWSVPPWLLRPHRNPTARRVLVALGVVLLAGSIVVGELHTQSAQQQTATAQAKTTAAQQTAKAVADPLAALCASDPTVRQRVGTACDTATVVAAQPGPAGPAGRGITGTSIDAAGHLLLTYTDGATVDVGRVVGHAGPAGEAGISITGSTISGGHLLLAYSDGTTEDVGQVVGSPGPTGAAGAAGAPGARGDVGASGRGVQSVAISNGRLVVTYSDGSTADAGAVPPGPAGAVGPAGPAGPKGDTGSSAPPQSFTLAVSGASTETCSRSGGTDAAPAYACQ